MAALTLLAFTLDVPGRLSSLEAQVDSLQGDSARLARVECLVKSLVLNVDAMTLGCWELP